ncbi:MAG: hypothetical protein PUB96_08675 [Helicobacteraceae bacterium]|nr:hypothetical protein [Helicobacteraceae bacterium]
MLINEKIKEINNIYTNIQNIKGEILNNNTQEISKELDKAKVTLESSIKNELQKHNNELSGQISQATQASLRVAETQARDKAQEITQEFLNNRIPTLESTIDNKASAFLAQNLDNIKAQVREAAKIEVNKSGAIESAVKESVQESIKNIDIQELTNNAINYDKIQVDLSKVSQKVAPKILNDRVFIQNLKDSTQDLINTQIKSKESQEFIKSESVRAFLAAIDEESIIKHKHLYFLQLAQLQIGIKLERIFSLINRIPLDFKDLPRQNKIKVI